MPKFLCCFLLFLSVSAQAAIVSQESFETDGEGTRYTASNVCNDGQADFFTRTDGSNIGSFYEVTGQDGSFYWAAQDTNGDAPCGSEESLTLNAIDVSGLTNLSLELLVAEDQSADGNEDWDDDSAFIVEYAYDGSTFIPLVCFASASGINTEPLLDSDCNGTGDGSALSPAFQSFGGNIPDDPSDSLTIRLRVVALDAGDEDVAFDNIIINGDVAVDSPPQLTSTVPEDLAPGVQVTSSITLTFDEIVSATAAAVTLECNSSAQTFSGLPATADAIVLTPDADLPAGSSCNVTLLADEITDQDGTADSLDGDGNGSADGSPADDISFSFSTLTDPAPQVATTNPLADATGVATDTTITLNFNENVSLTDSAVTLDCGTPISITGLPANDVAAIQLTPASSLPALTQCTVNVLASAVTDVDGGDDPLDGNADGTGGDNFSFSFTTTEGVCGDSATLISAIQGNTGTPNLLNELVVIEGIVVGDFQDDTGSAASDTSLLEGFYVQEEDGDADGDATTSEGIFIFEGGPTATDVSPGDRVRITGTVSDNLAQTQLSGPTITICDSGNSVTPTQVLLPRQSADEYEAVEGMLVQFSQELTVSEIFNAVRFGELMVSDGRLIVPTQLAAPGVDANNQLALNELNQLLLDDGRDGSNGEPLAYGFTADNPQRAGDTFTDVRGVMGFAFGAFRLRPVDDEFFVANGTNARTAQPDEVGGSLKVAAFNVLNYFTTIDTGGAVCGPGLVGCRGADSTSEFTRQEAKIVAALLALDAQLVGLVELENNASQSLADLVDALNTAAGEPGRYAFVDTGLIGADVIKVGLIYQPAAVTPTGSFAVLDSTVDPLFDSFLNRPVLAQTFTANGESFTVAVNHFKSKSCSNATGDNLGQGDGQGCFNAARTDAAAALATWLASDPTGSGDPDVLILGDLNAYAMEDPLTALRDGGFIDLIARDLGSNAYSFRFNRQAGYLDHALATSTLGLQVTGVTGWPINADESRLLDYNEEAVSGLVKPASFFSDSAYRSSDHDPIVIGLELAPLPDEVFSNGFEEDAPIMR